jgi:hypothetical protein
LLSLPKLREFLSLLDLGSNCAIDLTTLHGSTENTPCKVALPTIPLSRADREGPQIGFPAGPAPK